MSEIRPKRLPVRLDAKAYRELCKEELGYVSVSSRIWRSLGKSGLMLRQPDAALVCPSCEKPGELRTQMGSLTEV
jgi:hypothetical protein